MKKIMNRIMDDYNFLVQSGYEVVGVFLFGSQNYKCAIETSDIDTKAVILSSAENLITNKGTVRKTISRDGGELTIFDINSMADSIKKQNINFLEILFTDYFYVNPRYVELCSTMRTHREEIARLSPYAAVQCIYGCIVNKFKKVFHPVVSNINAITKYGYDNKAAADVIRLTEFLEMYITGCSYESCLYPLSRSEIIRLKREGNIPVDTIHELMPELQERANTLLSSYIESHTATVNQDIVDLIDKVTIDCYKAYLKERMCIEEWPTLLS